MLRSIDNQWKGRRRTCRAWLPIFKFPKMGSLLSVWLVIQIHKQSSQSPWWQSIRHLTLNLVGIWHWSLTTLLVMRPPNLHLFESTYYWYWSTPSVTYVPNGSNLFNRVKRSICTERPKACLELLTWMISPTPRAKKWPSGLHASEDPKPSSDGNSISVRVIGVISSSDIPLFSDRTATKSDHKPGTPHDMDYL